MVNICLYRQTVRSIRAGTFSLIYDVPSAGDTARYTTASSASWVISVPHLLRPSPRGRYEHLVNLLTKILNQRPEDPLFLLESLNRTTQWEWFHPKLDTLRDDPEMQPTYEMAERQKALFSRSGSGEGEQEMEEETVSEPVRRPERQKEPEWRDRH